MNDLGKQICRCIVGACDETCKYYDAEKACCVGYEEVAELAEKVFAEYENYKNLEEQGKLLKLPCAVDSEVWYIDKYANLYIDIVRGVVDGYLWYRTCGFALNVIWDKPIMGHFGYKRKEMPFSEIGKTVFLTKDEAESALKEL